LAKRQRTLQAMMLKARRHANDRDELCSVQTSKLKNLTIEMRKRKFEITRENWKDNSFALFD